MQCKVNCAKTRNLAEILFEIEQSQIMIRELILKWSAKSIVLGSLVWFGFLTLSTARFGACRRWLKQHQNSAADNIFVF